MTAAARLHDRAEAVQRDEGANEMNEKEMPFNEPRAGEEEKREARSASSLGIDSRLADKLAEAGIAEPTEVQAEAWPPLLAGRDAVLRSPTGSGKTLAYLLPLLQRLDPDRRETQAIVLAPTQELAMQIVRVAEHYGEPLGIKTVALIGGAALSRQLERMKNRPALVVGTPGRVREIVLRKKLPLPAVRMVVVDETDRVFSLGGKKDVEAILHGTSRERQTVFVSATRTEAMREAESRWLKEPFVAEAANNGTAAGLPDTIGHWVFVCDRRDKIDTVRRIARSVKPSSAMIFVNDTEKIAELVAKLKYEGFTVEALYGDTGGNDRSEALRKFREGRTKLLVATDVAARGLDIPSLPLVIQFEPALDADHYVHRAGRTGRMGRSGVSVTLVSPQERFIIGKLAKKLGVDFEEKALREGQVIGAGEAERKRAPAKQADRPRNEAAFSGKGEKAAPAREASRGSGFSGGRANGKADGTMKGKAASMMNGKATDGSMHGKPDSAPPKPKPARAPSGPAKAKTDRAKKNKDKGAPRWLKEKREQSRPPAE